MSKRLIAIGSAHLDVIATSHGDPHGIDQPGEVRLDVGGSACNIAINWVKMGAQGVLLTAFRPGPVASLIERHLHSQGVELFADANFRLPVGGYCAHLNSDGELLAGVSEAPVESHLFTEERIEDALRDADMVVADCNLSEETLASIGMEAIARAVPLYVCAVSEEKSLRMAAIRGLPTLVSLSEREARYFIFQIQNRILKDPLGLAQAIAEFMKCDCLLTLNERGAIHAPPDGPPKWERQEDFAFAGNRLGSTEGLLAAFVLACAHGAPPRMALPRALRVAGLIANKDQVNLGDANPLDQALEALFSETPDDLDLRPVERRDAPAERLCALFCKLELSELVEGAPLDSLMAEISRAVGSALRAGDIVARWGPEEMICLLPGAMPSEAERVAQRARRAFEESEAFDQGARLRLGVSARVLATETLAETVQRARESLLSEAADATLELHGGGAKESSEETDENNRVTPAHDAE